MVRAWFARTFAAPTEIQRRCWGPLADGEHVLAVAPTGSGKTLTGFLWPLDRLLTGGWEGGGLRLLYVSPLKALNVDIERNLVAPLAGIAAALEAAGLPPRPVRVGVRSGDTPPAERARQVRRPPEILITTPESLNLLLLQRRAGQLFSGLRMVLLDEIHAVAGNKRGTHLITAVERLAQLVGEFQRVAISATVRPVDRVARFVGGYRLERGAGGEPLHLRRPVRVIEAAERKRYELAVRALPGPADGESGPPDAAWLRLAEELRARITEARSTLVFTNSRRQAEKLTRLINDAAGRELAWSHHGSLARELRTAVERRLKEGALPAIVATSSLELGIDVGALDRVLLIASPPTLASAAQRIGRAGHQVGRASRALFYPVHARDFLDCAVAARAVLEGEIEPIEVVRAPLDLLAQTLLGWVAHQSWRLDDLYAATRTAAPFHDLPRGQFDLVVEMLAGRYAETRLPELRPRVAVDRLDGTVSARPGAARLRARAGGTIPDRGYFQLRLEDSQARLGELDEEFVWERRVGDSFTLGAQGWRIRRITANEVMVAPARGGATLAPFWRADARDRGSFFALRIAELLERAESRLDEPAFAAELARDHALEAGAVEQLLALLRVTRAALGGVLPHRRRLVFEESEERSDGGEQRSIVLYTFWGGRVNRPLALALAAAWEEREGSAVEVVADDDAILLVLPEGADPRALLAAVAPESCERLLRRRLEGSGFFGAHFRQNAQRALLLPRAGPARRTPLWRSRQYAKQLLEAVSAFDDFPILVETWRTCLQDEFELGELRAKLTELATGAVQMVHVRTPRPSPLAAGLVWRRTNELMYEDDAPETRRASPLRGDLIREVALGGEGSPLPLRLVERFRAVAQRLPPGYPPASGGELVEWVKERLLIPPEEWRQLVAAIDRDTRGDAARIVAEAAPKLELLPGLGQVAREVRLATTGPGLWLRRRAAADEPGAAAAAAEAALVDFLASWLPAQGALRVDELAMLLDEPVERVRAAVVGLVETERAVSGPLVAGETGTWVAALGSYETLLRWRRAAARPSLEPSPLESLPLFLAETQGLTSARSGTEGLQAALERLFGWSAPAAAWETEILPARLDGYQPSWLDTLFEEHGLRWFGSGRERVALGLDRDLPWLADPDAAGAAEGSEEGVPPGAEAALALLERFPRGLGLAEVADHLALGSAEAARLLWALAWRGQLASDSMRALRQGVLTKFELPEDTPAEMARSRRGAFRRWVSSRPLAGRWFAGAGREAEDPLDRETVARERARVVLDRYGVVFRELLAAEPAPFAWGRLVRSLRTLELAGEIVSGHFFRGVPGLQFATPDAVRRLGAGSSGAPIWWVSGVDPASACGLDLDGLRGKLPRRSASTHLVYRGSELLLIAKRAGRELELRTVPDDPVNALLMAPIRSALTRTFSPARAVDIETINGAPAARSPYRTAFAAFDSTGEGAGLRLRRRYTGAG